MIFCLFSIFYVFDYDLKKNVIPKELGFCTEFMKEKTIHLVRIQKTFIFYLSKNLFI